METLNLKTLRTKEVGVDIEDVVTAERVVVGVTVATTDSSTDILETAER